MKRADIRHLKRRLVRDQDADAALQLLRRSVQFRHGRLAAKRLDEAMALGATLPSDLTAYFISLPQRMRDDMLIVAAHPKTRSLLRAAPGPK